jgi:hypothetical protein
MMTPVRLRSVVFAVAFALGTISWGAGPLVTRDFNDVYREVVRQIDQQGVTNTLVAFDIDNTLLATKHDLGSVQWFNWQRHLLKSEPNSEYVVAESMDKLLNVQMTLYALSNMRETQEEVSDHISSLQNKGLKTIALTARSPESRDATVRELQRNGISFRSSALGGISRRTRLPERTSYADGIFMLAGQHKGQMLRELLRLTKSQFSSIVFVDDEEHNLQNVRSAFEGGDIKLTLIRFAREDTAVETFNKSDKKEVARDWKKVSAVLRSVFEY